MDIRELDKKQLILLTLLITFVVSIATGIVTVSLMNQMPKSVPQTVNNVIQRTIEKVTTVQAPAPTPAKKEDDTEKNNAVMLSDSNEALVSIYLKSTDTTNIGVESDGTDENSKKEPAAVGQGVIISDVGLILVDSSLLDETLSYKVVLDKTDFDLSVLKKFGNGFTILKISAITDELETDTVEDNTTDTPNN